MKAQVEPVTITVRAPTLVGAGKVVEERQEFAVICDDPDCDGLMQTGFDVKAGAQIVADLHNSELHPDE